MRKLFWPFLFLLIILLTLSHLVVDFSPTPWFLGLPLWLYWYALLHTLFIGGLLIYIKKLKEE